MLKLSKLFEQPTHAAMKGRQLTLPLFPLHMVLLPGETTKLHIFEERYKQLVEDCLDNDAAFGIPYLEHGNMPGYGCEVKISRILKTYSNGSLDILVEGNSIFKLLDYTEILRPKLYGAGLVEFLPNSQKITLASLQDATVNYFGSIQNKLIDYETVSQLTVLNVAAALQLTYPEKYRLITAANQQVHLLNQLNFIIHIIQTEQELKDRFIDN